MCSNKNIGKKGINKPVTVQIITISDEWVKGTLSSIKKGNKYIDFWTSYDNFPIQDCDRIEVYYRGALLYYGDIIYQKRADFSKIFTGFEEAKILGGLGLPEEAEIGDFVTLLNRSFPFKADSNGKATEIGNIIFELKIIGDGLLSDEDLERLNLSSLQKQRPDDLKQKFLYLDAFGNRVKI